MNYQALYRVWRPQQFIDVVGQEHVTKTLQNALLQQKISHAYLFSGPRGTGKTSAAKILAKAVNCERAPISEPCNECDACRGITDGTIPDVIEIDAASNNGVEEIRDIRDKVKFAPSSVPYKVYIIDEVHMLSIGAFNALLKTLEEPPKHVIFILATTEPHKIPLTIISRCQRFDFRRITSQAIVNRMRLIMDESAISCEEKALQMIARAADGGMRDALSLLDQAISYSNEVVTVEDALTVTGAVSQNFLNTLSRAILDGDTVRGLQSLDELLLAGKDSNRFIEDFIFFYRDMLLYKTAPNLEESLERVLLDDDFKDLAETHTHEQIYELINLLNRTQQDMRWTNHPRIFLEVAIVKLCQLEAPNISGQSNVNIPEIQSLLSKVSSLEEELANIKQKGVTVVAETQPTQKKTRTNRKGFQAPLGKITETLKNATKQELQSIKGNWGAMLNTLVQNQMRSQAALLNEAEPVAASTDSIIIKFKYEIHCQMALDNVKFIETITNSLYQLLGKRYNLLGVPEEQWLNIREEFLNSSQHLEASEEGDGEERQDNPVVSEAIKLFGEELLEVKD
ncbi:DNA polymerase III subunit gamma/tau [Niallia circulans]|uniref:DNA polymerase III subunit gamma/tau n=1 Tax=Niallia circulans TaxID=1397 RepID=UPI0014907B3C|nr:DNA polymerase III subunit gamma/tau [Niallia circulans]QJX60248.1 DNA polymerase III subunit gamma/tau [Niallia circulans]